MVPSRGCAAASGNPAPRAPASRCAHLLLGLLRGWRHQCAGLASSQSRAFPTPCCTRSWLGRGVRSQSRCCDSIQGSTLPRPRKYSFVQTAQLPAWDHCMAPSPAHTMSQTCAVSKVLHAHPPRSVTWIDVVKYLTTSIQTAPETTPSAHKTTPPPQGHAALSLGLTSSVLSNYTNLGTTPRPHRTARSVLFD